MARKRSREGVAIIAPQEFTSKKDGRTRRTQWRLKFVDPKNDKTKWETIPAWARKTKRDREDYAVRKADQLDRERLAYASGATRATGTGIDEAVERYYAAHPNWRGKTLAAYEASTDKFIDFCARARIKTVDDLTRGKIVDFRTQIVNEPRKRQASGMARGARVETIDRRSSYSINRDLRGVKQLLNWLDDADELASLSDKDIKRALKPERIEHRRKHYLKSKQIGKLFDAALRHDEATFTQTRDDVFNGTRNTTSKHESVAPFVAFMLLTGCRVGEAFRLEWSQVDLDDGTVLIDSRSKTRRERIIDLDVTPSLRSVLTALKLRTGGKGPVFDWTEGELKKALTRLVDTYGAPCFTWQDLRVTCQSYLASAPGIYGGASIHRAASRGGHSVAVCEKHYANAVRGIDRDAGTLEAAMKIEKQCAQITSAVQKRRAA